MAFSTHDQTPHSPTNVFATLNPLNTSGATISNGNLVYSISGTGTWYSTSFTIPIPKSGKYIIEFMVTGGSLNNVIGITSAKVASSWSSNPPASHTAGEGYGFYAYDGSLSHNGTTLTSPPTGYSVGIDSSKVYFMLIDCDTNDGSLYFGRDGNLFNNTAAYTNIFSTITDVMVGYISTANNTTQLLNFGADSSFGGNKTSGSANATDANGLGQFYYDPPTGALALCTANIQNSLAIDPALDELPEDNFKAVKYSVGTGTTVSVDVGFNADLHWIKCIDANERHYLVDTVRSTTSTYDDFLNSNNTDSEDNANDDVINATLTKVTNGFEVSTTDATSGELYFTNRSYISWNWKAGGAPSGATSATGSAKRINSSGTQDDTSCDALATAVSATITPTLMSINQKSGFSIIKYSSPDDSGGAVSTATVPHGLSSAPDLIICKNLDTGYNWDIYHSSVSYSAIFTTAAINSRNAFSTIDSNIFTTKDTFTHHDDDEYIAYCFTSIEGYSAFGSYTGTNSAADGPFIYTGFKPAFVMIKGIQIDVNYPDYYSWIMFDNQRPEYNSSNTLPLYANQAKVEGQRGGSTVSFGEGVDFLSNGFKIRNVWGEINYTFTYIYMAFAEMPQKYAATNAR